MKIISFVKTEIVTTSQQNVKHKLFHKIKCNQTKVKNNSSLFQSENGLNLVKNIEQAS